MVDLHISEVIVISVWVCDDCEGSMEETFEPIVFSRSCLLDTPHHHHSLPWTTLCWAELIIHALNESSLHPLVQYELTSQRHWSIDTQRSFGCLPWLRQPRMQLLGRKLKLCSSSSPSLGWYWFDLQVIPWHLNGANRLAQILPSHICYKSRCAHSEKGQRIFEILKILRPPPSPSQRSLL